ncbi:hypothetical protein GCM10027346_19360 [Hymenobacter seoulensis]
MFRQGPQAYSNWQGYTEGTFDSISRLTVAINAFLHYPMLLLWGKQTGSS